MRTRIAASEAARMVCDKPRVQRKRGLKFSKGVSYKPAWNPQLSTSALRFPLMNVINTFEHYRLLIPDLTGTESVCVLI